MQAVNACIEPQSRLGDLVTEIYRALREALQLLEPMTTADLVKEEAFRNDVKVHQKRLRRTYHRYRKSAGNKFSHGDCEYGVVLCFALGRA
jgi:hypothetical protein